MMPQAMPEAVDHDGTLVHKWRAAQLRRLGIPEPLAEVYADRVDWHQVARLGPTDLPGLPSAAAMPGAGAGAGAASGIWGGTTQDERRALRTAAARHRHRARKTTVHE